jgi:hypothetical protein
MVYAQAATISDLQELVLNNDIKSTKAYKQVLTLANGIEAHQRRWALRIIGMDSPTNTDETTEQAKHLVLDFVKDYLKIDNVCFEDIDCAHRIGRVVNNKQTMLIRCFSRDLVHIMLKNRSNLKDSPYVLYEDSPLLNRQQLQELKDDPRTESAWIYNGAVWAKMAANGKIVKFVLSDDIDAKILEESAKHLGRPTQTRPKFARIPRAAWNKNKQKCQPPRQHLNHLHSYTNCHHQDDRQRITE